MGDSDVIRCGCCMTWLYCCLVGYYMGIQYGVGGACVWNDRGVGAAIMTWAIDWADVTMVCSSWIVDGGYEAQLVTTNLTWGSLESSWMMN